MDANHQIVSDNKASSVRWRPRGGAELHARLHRAAGRIFQTDE